eukprot:CCRYP_018873-RA/>CCRYP_018873-RA protein AED:0.97 eAED:1.00 QI:0/0/0/0.5/0/0.5/2/0/78
MIGNVMSECLKEYSITFGVITQVILMTSIPDIFLVESLAADPRDVPKLLSQRDSWLYRDSSETRCSSALLSAVTFSTL